MTGLAVVPLLPYLYDHPVETATEHAFNWIRAQWIGRGSGAAKERTDL